MRTAQLAAALVVACITAAPAAQAGRWTYHEERNDGHILAYVDDGKIVFELACGRGFSLLIKDPARAKTDGKARLTLAAGTNIINLAGEFVPPAENSAANFYQSYLGYGKNDERVYGKRWQERVTPARRHRIQIGLHDRGRRGNLSSAGGRHRQVAQALRPLRLWLLGDAKRIPERDQLALAALRARIAR